MRHYDAAVSAGPSYQTGHVLCAGITGMPDEDITGQVCQILGLSILGTGYQNGGVNSEALEWLRNYVRD